LSGSSSTTRTRPAGTSTLIDPASPDERNRSRREEVSSLLRV
jgi:hypothetical protein